jgi:hypothetical protein
MTTNPKTRKAPAAGGLSLDQQDALDMTRRLVWLLDLAVDGTELGDHDKGALITLVRLVDDRLAALAVAAITSIEEDEI